MSERVNIGWGEWSLDDFVKQANVPPSTLDIADEQIRYDAMYQLLDPQLVAAVSHDSHVIDDLRMVYWPRRSLSPILVVGSGGSQGLRKLLKFGYDAYGVDISREVKKYYSGIEDRFAVAASHNLPFDDDAFAGILCCDVLEHVKPELIDKTFDEFRRLATKYLALWVCCDESGGIKDMHPTIRPQEWWRDKFSSLGRILIELCGEEDKEHLAKKHYGALIDL